MKRYTVKFKYADAWSKWEWREQECSVCAKNEAEAVKEAKRIYGLGVDCDYEILEVIEE